MPESRLIFTIRELEKWAKENNALDAPIVIEDEDGNRDIPNFEYEIDYLKCNRLTVVITKS